MHVYRYALNSMSSALSDLYKQACRLDIQALKPGNVSVHTEMNDLVAEDFIRSADASVGPLVDSNSSLGERILDAVKATRQAVKTNTNLGIILLVAPLIHAYLKKQAGDSIEESLRHVLEKTTIEDAVHVYHAIRLAEPGGMGKKNNQDLSEEPTVTLLNTMKIAASWDRIADQYSNNFKEIFSFGIPRYNFLLDKWRDPKWATTGLFLGFLARFPDSLIQRKHGILKAQEISDMITQLERELNT